MAEEETCYICHEEQLEGVPFKDPNPCDCKGTLRIHTTCFNELVTITDKCGICKKPWTRNGSIIMYWPNGQKKEERNYVNGKMEGLYQRWHSNGRKRGVFNMFNDKSHGPCQEWYSNGQIYRKISFINGNRHGLCEEWDDDGTKLPDRYYDNNILVGVPYSPMEFFNFCMARN